MQKLRLTTIAASLSNNYAGATLNNWGTIEGHTLAAIANYGTLNNIGTIYTYNSNANLVNNAGATLNNSGIISLNSIGWSNHNYGTLNNSGILRSIYDI